MGSTRLLAPDINNQKNEDIHLPPGFRFHPTDEELVVYYLTKKVVNGNFPAFVISEVDLNKCEPWDLPAKAKMGEKEWYFFSLRDRKYPTGMRTNRATEAGYWKATGKDREVMSSGTGELVGMKKTLVFYRGRAPKGEKTNWIMHEYRIEGEPTPLIHSSKLSKDEWVVCRIFQKSAGGKKIPMECNTSSSMHHHRSSTTFNTETRSSLPALLESPNPNSVDDSDCLMENGFHGTVQDAMRSTNSWGGMKTEMGATLEDLHQGKTSLLRCPSSLLDLYASVAEIGGPTSSGLKIDTGAYTRLLRQDSSMNFSLQQAQLMSMKYLEPQPGSRGMNNSNLRACKSEPYAGEEDEAHSTASQRSSLMDSWVVADSSGGFTGEPALPSMANESSVTDLDNNNTNNNTSNNTNSNNPYFRYSSRVGSGTFIADPTNTVAGGELTECLWAY
ncbi:unnamed protein product [Calypogeia fissa]